jgi:hypothetical protein
MELEVTVDVVIDDGPHAGPGRLTALRLLWRPHDPFAVLLRLTALPEHPALPRGEWVIARDLLRQALDRPAGDGAVRLRPDVLRDRVWFELERPGRDACLSVPREDVRDFLERTELHVPAGTEPVGTAVDRLLARVFTV